MKDLSDSKGVSVVIPTWRRPDQVLETIARIKNCEPKPAEIIVHVDAGDDVTSGIIKVKYPSVQILRSYTKMGPGGGRNKLMRAARFPIVASFDDDSYPIDTDYFGRLYRVFTEEPETAIVMARIFHRGEELCPSTSERHPVADFIGCGCAFRREAFLETSGYVPRAIGYGLEETDMALQLFDRGWRIVYDGTLRVFHDTDLHHHESASITAGTIVNRALQAYLRYPVSYWPFGVGQYFKRIFWLLANRRYQGVLTGIVSTIPELIRHRSQRRPVRRDAMKKYLHLRNARH